MMKKNGFISISVVYSFFVVFMLLLLIIINSYVNNRASFDIYKDYVKQEMAGKYFDSGDNTKKLNDVIKKMYDDSTNNYRKTDWNTRNWYIDKVGNDYYFRGTTPPNFVCLSTDSKDNCQIDTSSLYRIIGVFKANSAMTDDSSLNDKYLVKLVKFNAYTTAKHSDIYGVLAQYADSTSLFDSKTRAMVAPIKQTGFTGSDISGKFDTMLSNETANANRQAETSFAGLLTISDIGYTTGDFSNCKPSELTIDNLSGVYNGTNTGCSSYGWNISEQWLYNSDNYTTYNNGFKINNLGKIEFYNSSDVDEDIVLSIKPVIYLKPDAIILEGTGSQDNPYILNIHGEDVIGE